MFDPLVRPSRPIECGLRERKKRQTRSRIIAVALRLCDTQGFDATTVEQIAAAADVSPRTVNRYFEVKEDIVLAPIEELGNALAEELSAQPVIGNELQSLLDAYLVVVARFTATDEPLSFEWFQQMHRIMQASTTVRARSLDFADKKMHEVGPVLARRLGTVPDSLCVRLIVGIWNTICRAGLECEMAGIATADPGSPEVAAAAVTSAYHEFASRCAVPVASAARE
jgi:AcrR family transcriptional regulator